MPIAVPPADTLSRLLARSAALPVLLTVLALAAPRRGDAQATRAVRPAPDASPTALTRLSTPVTLDGRVADAEWAHVPALPLSQFQPDPGGRMRDRSEIRLAYDDRYLYASGRFWDAERDAIRASSLLRDHYAEDDYLNLVLDTYHDRTSAVWFVVTPNGTRIDGSISNDAEGPERRWNHPEYDMPWDAAATRTEEGWSVEVRIPLSTLRFDVHDGQVTMGVIAARLISRRKERHIFPAIRPTVAVAQFKPSLAAPVTLDLGSAPRLFALTPYVLAGERVRRADVAAGRAARHGLHEVGADLKLGLSSRLTLDLTLNTDFAQTEVDDQRVNLSRFSLFFPERRQFFLERAGLFDVGTGGEDRVFYSRRIGLDPRGQPTRVLGGARLVGRVGAWDLGALDLLLHDDRGRAAVNAGVVRARREMLNPFSYVGLIATGASGDGSAGRSLGVDGTLRLTDADFLVWSGATTWGGDAPAAPARDGSALRAAWEHRRRAGLSGSGELRVVGAAYAPSLGFVERSNVAIATARASHGWVGVQGAIQERSLGVQATLARGLTSGELESVVAGPTATLVRVGGADLSLTARVRREVLADSFHLGSRAVVAPGHHEWREMALSAGSSPGALARVRVDVEGGGFYAGRRVSAALRPTWNPSSHLELTGAVEVNRVRLDDGGRFAGDLLRLHARVAVDPRLSLSGGAQYNRAERLVTGSLRLRYAYREGTDLFVVLDTERLGDRDGADSPGRRGARYVAAKYRYTFR